MDLLVQAGHDVETVAQEGLKGSPDRVVKAACHRDGRCLVTLDLDFGNPLIFKPAAHAGIAVLRFPHRPSLQDLYDQVRTLIGGLERSSIRGKLWVIQRGRIRQYEPEEDEEHG